MLSLLHSIENNNIVSFLSEINVKLSDYGISRLLTPYGLMQSEGTVGYRAPEVLRGQVYGVKADIYSLGIALFGLLYEGRHPFEDVAFQVSES